MNDPVILWATTIARWLERALAAAILVAVIAFAFSTAGVPADMDWRRSETFYEMIYRVLILVIGVELIRTLVTHDLGAVLELVAFVIARKLLKPDLTALDILLSVSAFVGLLAARRFLLRPLSCNAREEGGSRYDRAAQQMGGST
ncbi:MAG: hypothetical protein HY700_05655 [Gemmatimonadetes bacterium]|nr:hypothetical protein [Gemmatimonadota bacterium]